ncbi:PHD-zinc-finger like domain-containing protein [Massariosphaeria phaeospora]|uniref:PHD-zinc-finger like domain-containing protein n=1 Tax=Massariosphaeria phaeospora TaxID=100035 RepID=A0A7C8IGB2_9PLEO|nr:PHD-zinc-finger like domain-containing protein [Massariosphaeria phaeospora]
MAPIPGTPKQTRVRSARFENRGYDSAPPLKKRRYVPGGPGGGGRYVDVDGIETPVGGTGPGGYAYTGPRGRVGRLNAEKQGVPIIAPSPSASQARPRRDRPKAGPRSSSAAAVAAAVAQSDGYKPREERGWEEFHPDLDLEVEYPVFSAELVDGISPGISAPGTPIINVSSTAQFAVDSGASGVLDEALRAQQADQENGAIDTRVNGTYITPIKRRVGRPPRRLDSMLNGLGSPPAPRIQPLPTHNPKEKLTLPKPSCRPIDPFKEFEESEDVQVNYVSKALANIGYQTSEVFDKPEMSLIRVPEGNIEEDLDLRTDTDGAAGAVPLGRAEYDMDEQDDRWLQEINTRREVEGTEPIIPAIFEVTITQIEKEWHALEKRIPKPNPKPPQTHRPRSSSAAAVNGEPAGQGEEQDTKCAICDDGDCENTNAIVFCDGCDLAVHQECYGVPFIPEGQWLCRRCQLVGRGTPVSEHPGCIFCPNIDGAFKQTTAMKWAHLLCAMWIPEVSLGNATFQEPVQDVEKVPKTRWKLSCYICKQKMGACIQCGHKSCFEAFHVTCARRARLCLRMKSATSQNSLDASVLKAFCDKHSPSDWKRENSTEDATADAKAFYRHTMRHVRWGDSQAHALSIGSTPCVPSVEGADEIPEPTSGNKRKRGQSTKSWRLPSGAPVVPQAVYHNVETAMQKFQVPKRKEFVQDACRYWTLKREARRGAALLKRLQLQMEAFSSMEITRRNFVGMGAAGRPRLQRRIEFAERLEEDMKQIRLLCEKVKEREAEKLKDVLILKEIVDTVYFPIPPLLEPILDRAQSLDSKGFFSEGFGSIQTKLDEKFYTSVQPFSEDIAAVFGSKIEFATITTVGAAQQQLSDVAHSLLTPEQKEIKKVAKRIFKFIQPLVEDAMRKESDLAGRPLEREFPDLEALLDQRLRQRPEASTTGDVLQQSTDATSFGVIENQLQAKEEASEDSRKESETLHLAPTPDDNSTDQHPNAQDEASDEAAIAAQLGQDTLHLSTNGTAHEDAMDIDQEGIGPHDSHTGTAPLTPPRSEKDLVAPLALGGTLWYMKEFDPKGTTIHDEQWSGRDILRAMSEELSELDDDELNGLADPTDAHPADGIVPETNVSDPQKAAARKRKRARGYR